jgi:hypothetical protein
MVNHFNSITSLKRSFRLVATIVALTCGLAGNANAAIIQVFFAIEDPIFLLDNDGNPLADGSIIQLIQSGADGLANGFQTYGNDFLLDTTQGDDVILATFTSGYNFFDPSTPLTNGNFFIRAEIDDSTDLANTYFYVRFFDFQLSNLGNLQGVSSNLYWGQTALFLATNFYDSFSGTIEIYPGTQTADLRATNNNSFTVIPEPSTMSFFALVGGMAVAMRNQLMRRKRRQELEAAQAADESPTG